MKRTSIEKVIVYYAYWSNKELFGVHAADEDRIEIAVHYEGNYTRRFYFGGYKGSALPLEAVERTVPKTVQEFISKAKDRTVFEYREKGYTPFDQFTFR